MQISLTLLKLNELGKPARKRAIRDYLLDANRRRYDDDAPALLELRIEEEIWKLVSRFLGPPCQTLFNHKSDNKLFKIDLIFSTSLLSLGKMLDLKDLSNFFETFAERNPDFKIKTRISFDNEVSVRVEMEQSKLRLSAMENIEELLKAYISTLLEKFDRKIEKHTRAFIKENKSAILNEMKEMNRLYLDNGQWFPISESTLSYVTA